jgi:hypothetical protein
LRGARRRTVAIAWQIANFVRADSLKDLDHYLKAGVLDESRGGAALLGTLLAMHKRGVPMDIKKLN